MNGRILAEPRDARQIAAHPSPEALLTAVTAFLDAPRIRNSQMQCFGCSGRDQAQSVDQELRSVLAVLASHLLSIPVRYAVASSKALPKQC